MGPAYGSKPGTPAASVVRVRGSAQPDRILSSWVTTVFLDISLSSVSRNATQEMSHHWALCNRNIKLHLIHLALLLLAEEGTAFSPSICLASWSLGAQLKKPSLKLWHLWSPSAFQKSARNVRNAAAHSSCSYFISYTLLFPVHHFYLHSLTAFFFCPSFENTAAPFCCPHRQVPGLHWPLLISSVACVSLFL